MPDIVRLRHVGPNHVMVPLLGAGVGLGRLVEPDEVIDVAAKVVANDAEADHFVLELFNPAEQRVFPRSLWSIETGRKKTKADAPTEAAEESESDGEKVEE